MYEGGFWWNLGWRLGNVRICKGGKETGRSVEKVVREERGLVGKAVVGIRCSRHVSLNRSFPEEATRRGHGAASKRWQTE